MERRYFLVYYVSMTHISREIAPFKCVLGKRRDDHPTLSLRLDYSGLGQFCSIHANSHFSPRILIPLKELLCHYIAKRECYIMTLLMEINFYMTNEIKVYTKREFRNCDFS